MKIMRLFSRLNIGGPSLHVVNLSFGLNQYGYETLLVVGSLGKSEGDMSPYATSKGVIPHQIPEFQPALHPWRDLVAFIKILKLMRSYRPDIVHTHTFKAGLLGRIAAFICRVPCRVHTYHGHLLEGYGSGLRTKIIVAIEKFLNLLTHQVIAVSDRVGQDLVRHHIVSKSKMNTVELGFDVDQFLEDLKSKASTVRQRFNISNSDLVVGLAGRLVPVKNVDRFLNALSTLSSQFPSLKAVIIGDGEERIRLEALAKTLPGTFYFTGWILPLTPEFKDIDLLVCSSENEGTSVSVIEAVLSGVPVVSTEVGGMPDLLRNGEYGDLVASNTEALASKVSQRLKLLNKNDLQSSSESDEFKNRTLKAAQAFYNRFHIHRLILDMHQLYQKQLLAVPDESAVTRK